MNSLKLESLVNTPSEESFAYNSNEFYAYLSNTVEGVFVLDLSKSTLFEVLDELVRLKSKMSPRFEKQLSCLRHNLGEIQLRFGCTLMPYQITDVFWYNFVPYLINKGLAISSIKTMCSQLRSAIDWAAKHRAMVAPTFDLIKLPSYCHQQIALTPDEVSRIYHFNISAIPRRKQYLRHLDIVRDMFILSCNLGQRFSDMIRIDRSCFDRNIFTILQQKTGNYARVDIERMSIDRNTTYAILEKYNYHAPLTTDISAYDRYIKQLLQYVGLNEQIKRETRVNGHIEVSFSPKWKLVGSHTARRTFATINVMRGYRESEIRRATGHKSESSFEKYICYFDD